MLDNKSYRIKANVSQDSVLNVNLNQDFDILEVLSLKIDTDSVYKFHTSNYGCIAGRVLANGGFGIPNAKISVFIEATDEDIADSIMSYLYPYKNTNSKNADNIRYNLLPEDKLSDCHQNVGTFPSKRMVLDDNNVFEVYDKYYKFTTRSNEAGDYMIFGVPTGNQTLHVDIDLSDIGILSQRPRDMIYKGYNLTQFENANMFKKDSNLDSLAQIITQNSNVYVYPFWGESSEGEIAISRKDIEIQYKFEPTCVFMGSIISDESSNGISKRCIPSERMGKMDKLTTGKGTIEMIRDTGRVDGEGKQIIEEFIIQGNQLIDGSGAWCYQIPMNLDYVKTDEYGNIVPTDDPEKGIPTRTRVRFRMGLTDIENDNQYSHLTKILIPNNPQTFDDVDYVFGSATKDSSFKDLFWNNVYTVKSYIPRFQMGNIDRNKRFSGIKAVNVNNTNNPIPYNNMRVDLTFMFTLQCAVFRVLLWIVGTFNKIISYLAKNGPCGIGSGIRDNSNSRCLYIGDGYCSTLDGWYFAPSCTQDDVFQHTLDNVISDQEGDPQSIEVNNKEEISQSNICLTRQIDYFVQCVELTFAQEYDVIQFDFYNDWLNGVVYSPRWFADIRPKRSYLFGLIRINSRVNACMENTFNLFTRRYTQQCAMSYGYDESKDAYTNITTNKGCTEIKSKKGNEVQKCHTSHGRKWVKIFRNTTGGGGIVHEEPTMQQKNVYYLRPCEWLNNGVDRDVRCNLFATDIVLLGSLDENNSQGIPQTFKKLVPTSFQMPDPLASTNMGIEGYLYGMSDGSSKCSNDKGEKDIKVSPNMSTFENLSKWTRGKDYHESEPYDEEEYAVTESAGIDWGYIGPNQNIGKTNDIDSLYFPGGHFLGISCFNSEVNIKSCINLSRVCEIGTLFSQRQAIRNRDDKEDSYSYLVPTGLISKDEMNDGGFRSEFATMNYNGLKVKPCTDNPLMKEYDFVSINPVNFNGELNGKLGDEYNSTTWFKDDETGKSANKAYRRTIEENSKDYYRFRFGLHEDGKSSARKKYLIANYENTVSLPQYENSFYFYFGLKNGSTALDRFYEEYFAECPVLNMTTPYVKIVYVENTSTPCSEDGEAAIQTNIENPSIVLTKGGVDVTEKYKVDEFSFKNMPTGSYAVRVSGNNVEKITKYFEIISKTMDFRNSVTEFTEEHHYTKEDFAEGNIDLNSTGCFSISDLDTTDMLRLYVRSGENEHTLFGEESESEIVYHPSINGDMEKCYVWSGNTEYHLFADYPCKDHVHLTMFTVGMPVDIDIQIGDSSACTYKKMIKPLLENNKGEEEYILEKWFEILLGDNERGIDTSGVELRTEDIVLLEKALFWERSIGEFNTTAGTIRCKVIGSNAYTETLYGSGERLGSNVLDVSKLGKREALIEQGYSLDIGGFYAPTESVPSVSMSNYYFGYTQTMNKANFEYSVTDGQSSLPISGRLVIPSIYRPFFMQALFIRKGMHRCDCSYVIVNGITTDKEFNPLNINGNTTQHLKRGAKDYGKHIVNPNVDDIEKNYATLTGSLTDIRTNPYSISIMSRGGASVGINSEYEVNFLGDTDSEGKYYRYDNNIKYYAITAEEADIIKNRTTPYYYDGEKEYVSYDESTYTKDGKTYYNWTQNIWENLLSSNYISEQQMKTDDYNCEYVLGVFDNRYVDNSQCSKIITTISPRHISHITVFNIYTQQEFKDAVNAIMK